MDNDEPRRRYQGKDSVQQQHPLRIICGSDHPAPASLLLLRIRICICSVLLKQTAPAWSSASVEQRMRTALRWPKIASTAGSILVIKLADFTQDQIMNSHARSDRYRHGSLQQPQTDLGKLNFRDARAFGRPSNSSRRVKVI
jgi:hypothetical protein